MKELKEKTKRSKEKREKREYKVEKGKLRVYKREKELEGEYRIYPSGRYTFNLLEYR